MSEQRLLNDDDIETLYQALSCLHSDNPAHAPLRAMLERVGRLPKSPQLAPGEVLYRFFGGQPAPGPDGVPPTHDDAFNALTTIIELANNVTEYEAMLVLEEERADAAHTKHAREQLRAWSARLSAALGPCEFSPDGYLFYPTRPLPIAPVDPGPVVFEPLEVPVPVSDEAVGPDSFGGTDEESHYVAPAVMAEARAACCEVNQLDPTSHEAACEEPAMPKPPTGLTAEEHAEIAEMEAPSPEPLSLGHLDGVLTPEELAIARELAALSGYVPVVSISGPADGPPEQVSVVYRFVPKWGPPTRERTVLLKAGEWGEPAQLVAGALGEALREVRREGKGR